MSNNQMNPTWLLQSRDMGADFASSAVTIQFEDNIGIQCAWVGTPTGVFTVQISLDPPNLGWQSLTFTPAITQPAGSSGSNWIQVNQSSAAFVRLIYTFTSGAGSVSAKIALKSV